MEIKIIYEKENPIFSRKEVHLEISEKSVPSKDESRKIVAEKFSSPEELVRVKEVRGKFGINLFDIFADVYSSKEEFDRIVNKTKQEVDAEKKVIEDAKKAKEEENEAKKAEKEAKRAEEEAKKATFEKSVEEPKKEKKEEIVENNVKEEEASRGVFPKKEAEEKEKIE